MSTQTEQDLMQTLYDSIGVDRHALCRQEDVARVEIHHNRVLGLHLVPGLEVEADETDDGIDARIVVTRGSVIEKPVQVCFGMVPESGLQRIGLDIRLEEDAAAGIVAHCTFPNAKGIRHEMDARLTIGPHARYAYFERHVHGSAGGVTVLPVSKVEVQEGGHFQTDFELIKGRCGAIEIDLEATVRAHAAADISARVKGVEDDTVTIREVARLVGDHARGALKSHLALRQRARAEVYNEMIATAAHARGHVDCKEIVQEEAVARAVPVVEVNHPKAHVTHEAAIGSVDNKQLETLMSRGLDEDTAVDLIIQGMLRK